MGQLMNQLRSLLLLQRGRPLDITLDIQAPRTALQYPTFASISIPNMEVTVMKNRESTIASLYLNNCKDCFKKRSHLLAFHDAFQVCICRGVREEFETLSPWSHLKQHLCPCARVRGLSERIVASSSDLFNRDC